MIAPPLIYVAGPFSAPTREGVDANIAVAVRAGIQVAEMGGMPVIPHANTQHPEFERVQSYEFWLAGTLQLLRGCHAVFLIEDWQHSRGATGECSEAQRLGIPTFESFRDLARFVRDWNKCRGVSRKSEVSHG